MGTGKGQAVLSNMTGVSGGGSRQEEQALPAAGTRDNWV